MKKKRLRLDKLLLVVNILLVIVVVLSAAFSKAWLSKTNIDLESTKQKVSEQVKLNESLSMKVNELASIDKVQQVATNYGLGYNNSNIINITE